MSVFVCFCFATLAADQKYYAIGLLLMLLISSAQVTVTTAETAAPSSMKSQPVRTEVVVSIWIGILVGITLVIGLIKYYACRKKRLALPKG